MKNKYPWKAPLTDEDCCELITKLSVKNLSLSYNDELAFKDVSLEINQGCVTGIIGPSGSGKSSFIHCLNKMAETNPDVKITGDIFFNNESIFDSRIDVIKFRRKIGIVFQEPTPLPLSIETNIALPLKEHKFDNIEQRVEKALRDVGLWEEVKNKLKSPANNLSGGQKQRLCIARTLALEPEVILMDEPCSSLDPISTEKIENLIGDLSKDYTIVIVTHNLAQARRICDFVAVFWREEFGQIIESAKCIDIFENPVNQVVKEYIGGIKG